jgi:hypothetical protein
MEDIFRNSAWAGAIMDEVVEQFTPVIWTLSGVVDDAATLGAKDKGATVIVDRCPKVGTTFLSPSEIIILISRSLYINICLEQAFYFRRVPFPRALSHVYASRLSSKWRLATQQQVHTTFSMR